jgi:hypothetical protein
MLQGKGLGERFFSELSKFRERPSRVLKESSRQACLKNLMNVEEAKGVTQVKSDQIKSKIIYSHHNINKSRSFISKLSFRFQF